MSARVDAALVALAVRRGLALPVVAAAGMLAFFLVRADWGESSWPAMAGEAPARAESLARGLARQGVLGTLALLFAPFLVLRSATWAHDWRTTEAEWLRPRAAGRATIVLSAFVGLWLAAAAWIAGAALVADRTAGAGATALRVQPVAGSPSAVLHAGDAPLRWRLAADRTAGVPAGALVDVRVSTAPGSGPAADVRLTAARAGRETALERRVAGPTRLELEVPSGTGEVELELARLGPGRAVVVSGGSGRLLVPSASERLALVELGARLWIALGAWIALALGLGTRARAPTTLLAIVALWGAGWWRFGLPAWVPGSDLGPTLSAVGAGFVPSVSSPAVGAGLALFLAGGLALAVASLRDGRRAL